MTDRINPTWIIQTLIAVLISVTAYMANNQFELIKSHYTAIQVDVKQLRADMTALEIGLRGNRFTEHDWNRERKKLDEELKAIREDIERLEDHEH